MVCVGLRRVGRVPRGPPRPRGVPVGLVELGPPYMCLHVACAGVRRPADLPVVAGSPDPATPPTAGLLRAGETCGPAQCRGPETAAQRGPLALPTPAP